MPRYYKAPWAYEEDHDGYRDPYEEDDDAETEEDDDAETEEEDQDDEEEFYKYCDHNKGNDPQPQVSWIFPSPSKRVN